MTHQTKSDAGGCGCDDQPTTKLIPLADALERGLALAEPVTEIEQVALAGAIGRVLARDVTSPLPLPPFDNSAMDGYLLNTADLNGNGPWSLQVQGRIAAGDAGNVAPKAGSAWRILTGAIVPAGFDAVIMQEDTELRAHHIHFSRRPKPGQHIRRQGGDAAKGQVVVRAGAEIGARQAGALAAVGAGSVPVRRKVRVAIFSTGNELRQPGEPLETGQIWNSNRFTMLALLKKDWVEIVDLGAIPDEPELLGAALRDACASCDMLVTTGGVSVGEEDHMPRLFEEAGGTLSVMKVAIKPGKPVTYGALGKAVFVGLPGNPVSAFVTWLVIGARILEKRAGLLTPQQGRILVRIADKVTRRPGRIEFRPARYSESVQGEARQVEMLDSAFSGRVALLSAADGLVVIPAEASEIEKGEVLEFIPF